ncbi:MAG: phosphotransferase family protein [Burkholderiaceae bacterium]
MSLPTEGLTRALARAGLPAPSRIERLSGGANMQSWRFHAGGQTYVLRRLPSEAMIGSRTLGMAGEVQVIGAARQAGVPAPEVVVVLEAGDGLGAGFVMRAIPGSAEPTLILSVEEPGALMTEIAQALAATQRVDPASIPDVPLMVTADALGELRARFIQYGGNRPILALAVHWLETHLPAPVPPRLVHGDFRLGNLMVHDGHLSGVLDWELAHLGDPVEDLAYACMTVWRFSRPDRPALGLTPIVDWLAAYEAAGGGPVDRDRFRFWLVYRTFWWAISSLGMGYTWREGTDRSLERVVVARRCAEQELDLLLLLEDGAPAAERRRPMPPSAQPSPPRPPIGEPSAGEILTAISEWLASDVKKLVSGRGHFDLAVARNALGIVARELEQQPVATDSGLAADLLAGRRDLSTPGVLACLRRMALDKLTADRPKYPALATARARWP